MISRKRFVAAAALGASAVTLDGWPQAAKATARALHVPVLLPGQYDRAAMLATIQKQSENKQVFQSVNALVIENLASLYVHMQNSLNAFEFSFGMGRGSLATLAVLTGASIAFALNDEVWKRYGFGAAFKLAPTNIYYPAKSLRERGSPNDPESIYQDWSAEAVMHRGGAFMVCHNAMAGIAQSLAGQTGQTAQSVLDDFTANVLPGFQIVPAGVAATQLALEHGWQLYPVL